MKLHYNLTKKRLALLRASGLSNQQVVGYNDDELEFRYYGLLNFKGYCIGQINSMFQLIRQLTEILIKMLFNPLDSTVFFNREIRNH